MAITDPFKRTTPVSAGTLDGIIQLLEECDMTNAIAQLRGLRELYDRPPAMPIPPTEESGSGDAEYLLQLSELLELTEGLTPWEAEFIESLHQQSQARDLSPKQQAAITKIWRERC
jgi:hypothetical protein